MSSFQFREGKSHQDLVLIHGAGLYNKYWEETMLNLTGNRKSYAINLPAHPTGSIKFKTVQEYSDFVICFIKTLNISPVLCGHSMGGAIALQIALERPDLVKGLILVSTSPRFFVNPVLLKLLKEDPIRAIKDFITPLSFFEPSKDLLIRSSESLCLENLEVFAFDYQACNDFDVTKKLASVRIKTLVIAGQKDKMIKPRDSMLLAKEIADSKFFCIADAGHMLPIEKPEILASLINEFCMDLTY